MKDSIQGSLIMPVSDDPSQMFLNKSNSIEFRVCLRLPDLSSADGRCCPVGPLSPERERRLR